MKQKIAKLLAVNVPLTACNLKCHYCYISRQNRWNEGTPAHKYDPDKIERAFMPERFGGVCLINLTGKGETMIPPMMPEIIRRLLRQGHYLEVVTNGTLVQRFEEIASFEPELLSRLEFKFSFHYLELKRLNKLEDFFYVVDLMRSKGCSFTIELMPNDELLPYIDDIKAICLEKVGALCQLTIGRDDNDGRKILTNQSYDKYVSTWGAFDSDMFKFKIGLFNVKRKEFCYAGAWSLYINLATGEASQCYGFHPNQNIYKDLSNPVYFRPVGTHCKQPFCYNGHAYLSLGLIPELVTPTYYQIRNRVDSDGREWFSQSCKEAFSCKLCQTNKEYNCTQKLLFEVTQPCNYMKILITNKDKIKKKFRKKNK